MKRNKIILTIDLFFAIVLLLTFAFQDNIKNYMIQKRFQNNEYESSNDYQKLTFNNSLIIDTNEEKVYENMLGCRTECRTCNRHCCSGLCS